MMWNLEQALEFIRIQQIKFHKYNFHLALAGSVLNNGKSEKDLDIIIMAMGNKDASLDDIYTFLVDEYDADLLTYPDYDEVDTKTIYRSKYDGKVIDWFVYK